jgi:hypothetical protein
MPLTVTRAICSSPCISKTRLLQFHQSGNDAGRENNIRNEMIGKIGGDGADRQVVGILLDS